ncbi:MAG: hypothetical protein IPP33_12200 [Flavobacteriales bacterium]|nr:hypothetical protein [Flavobacteriales bacterium]
MPGARVGVGHGQPEGHQARRSDARFIGGNTDVLVCTTIVEERPRHPGNADTIIVNEAQNFGQRPAPIARSRGSEQRRRLLFASAKSAPAA